MPFKPGESGNPRGRPKGVRDKFSKDFVEAVAKDFEANGATTIEKVRATDPAAYLRVCAGLIPKELNLRDERDAPPAEMTTAALLERIERYRSEVSERFGGAGAKDSGDPEPSGLH